MCKTSCEIPLQADVLYSLRLYIQVITLMFFRIAQAGDKVCTVDSLHSKWFALCTVDRHFKPLLSHYISLFASWLMEGNQRWRVYTDWLPWLVKSVNRGVRLQRDLGYQVKCSMIVLLNDELVILKGHKLQNVTFHFT